MTTEYSTPRQAGYWTTEQSEYHEAMDVKKDFILRAFTYSVSDTNAESLYKKSL